MNLESIKTFLTDRRAVSPVLGVALLIAITVILAGVIGFVVLGVQAGNADGPSATLKFTQATDATSGTETVSVTHQGGDPLQLDNVVIRGDASASTFTAGDTLTTGETVEVATGGTTGDVVRVVWQDPNSDREVLLAEYTVE